jgi:F-type H+-transporting ATPase subunit delta
MAIRRTKEYAQALLELADGKSEDEVKKETKRFAEHLAKKGLLSEAPKIIEAYRSLYNEKHNIVEATVTLVNRLPERTRLQLRETLKKKYKAREVHILEKVDERILGGMKVKVGDEVYDATLKHSLSQLENQLLK